jgi:hypothetical protein
MKRVLSSLIVPLSILAMMCSAERAWAAIRSFTIDNQLDDSCNVFVNGAFATTIRPLSRSDSIPVGPSNVPGRTNILLRCSDGGVYGTSVEAEAQSCEFQVDEEGGGLHGHCL